MKYSVLLVSLLILFSGCVHVPSTGQTFLKTVPDSHFKDTEPHESMKRAINYSLEALSGLDPAERFDLFGNRTVTLNDLEESLVIFLMILEHTQNQEDLIMQIRKHFEFYEITGPVLFTGYYEPELPGSFEQTERFRYPIYRRPYELDQGGNSQHSARVPTLHKDPVIFSRAEIDTEGILSGRGLELLYLDDPVERFFLHIQGAGTIRLPDDQIIHVQYDGSNGRSYTSIGRFLIEEGEMLSGEATVPGIKKYLRVHTGEQGRIMNRNERYVFFKISETGSQGVLDMPLTPYRSIATDPGVIPVGSLCYLETQLPLVNEQEKEYGRKDYSGFAVSQDIGDAIQGLRRADLFMGTGPRAAAMAGHMMSEGKLYILLRK
jgi:membrane-bound lytic murein transglycosylase A